ncbi:MAG: protein-disulfide reductase DsbD [Burkholderiaceae bacterium]|nr:protein-disulfide reductase DsbD [Burkholderiaceae bacterium]
MLKLLLRSFLTLLLSAASAAHAADDFLEPEQAFKLAVRALNPTTLEVSYAIAPGYYMYREQFKFEAQGATLSTLDYPKGKVKFDETFQKEVETYRERFVLQVPVTPVGGAFKLSVTGQGCADQGLCYPPQTQVAEVDLSNPNAARITLVSADGQAETAAAGPSGAGGEGSHLDAALQSGRFWTVVGVFFIAGLLLSLTPCVLPMLPILSSIIVGRSGASASRGRSFLLAVSYSLGMALIYTALGVAAGLAGEGLAAALQKPWVLGLFALALVGFSLSMFGVYELQLPQALTGGLSNASQRLPAGQFAGVFVMGGVSALIVSPCVAAPLAGALVYISQSRDVLLGGTALFALACGMSVPLLLLGASAGAWLPRTGAWMDGVKHFFGLLLMGVALWTVQPVLPAGLALALWGALLIGGAIVFGLFEPAHVHGRPRLWLRKTATAVAALFGLLQLIGAASGGHDPLQPLRHWVGVAGAASPAGLPVAFQRVRSVAELDAVLASANRPVMLDFYADWCVSCKEMERFTFNEPAVRQRLGKALLLQADVTANNEADKALLRRFHLFGPPGIIFFDAQGKELDGVRVIGFQDAERFATSLSAAGI